METRPNPTLTRRRQRRPDLQSTFDVPEDLQHLISHVAHALMAVGGKGGESSGRSPAADKVVNATDKALHELLQPSLTPAQQLHAVSKITGAIKDIPKAQLGLVLTDHSGELYLWGRTLALDAVVPLLLDCRVRYLHRALMTLLRTLLPAPDAATAAQVRDMYVTRVLRRAGTATIGALTSSSLFACDASSPAAAAALYFPAASGNSDVAVSASRDVVLNFLNSVDGLTSTLMPMMPSIFADTFLEVLPLLAECFQWVVVNATSHSRSRVSPAAGHDGAAAAAVAPFERADIDSETADVDATGCEHGRNVDGDEEESSAMNAGVRSPSGPASGTVFGEDLEHIRFCVRVVATYIHKYMNSLTLAMQSGTAGGDVSRQLARLLQPTVVMLTSPIFPKDVLNAVGLLVASVLTVRTCDGWLLATVCAALRDDVARSAAAAGAETSNECDALVGVAGSSGSSNIKTVSTTLTLAELFARVETALGVMCAAQPETAAQAHGGAGAKALHDLFSAFTPNGCFALLKGILAHTSSPIRADWMSLGVLLTPRGTCDSTTVVAYDVILPAAQEFCNMVQEPETRFMAIQTVDSVVRHVNAVLHTAVAAVTKWRCDAERLDAPAPLPASAKAVKKGATLTEDACRHLESLCVSTPKLQAMLAFSTQLIMTLWDDGTQQMSGALYGTYNEILKISETLRMCGRQGRRGSETVTASASEDADTAVTLDQILDVQAERRGKYHALLGHLSMMPLEGFISVLQLHYRCESSMSGAVAAFARTLLSGASNHKIGNVAGDVFAQLARAIRSPSFASWCDAALSDSTRVCHPESAADVLGKGIVEPLARAMTEKDYVGVSSNVSEAVNVSHITAHFVTPLVKQDPAVLQAILSALIAKSTTLSAGEHVSSVGGGGASHERERVEQGVVEVLSRALSVGIDIVPYLAAPGSVVRPVLEASTHSLNYEVRNSALCLCVLGTKKMQAVQPWQMHKVEEYLVLNMHLGGDSTARKGLLELLKKWVRRLTESYASNGLGAGAKDTAAKVTKMHRREEPAETHAVTASASSTSDALQLGTPVYRHAVLQHCATLADIFAQSIGVDVRASTGLAVERRVTAMMGYITLLQGMQTMVPGANEEGVWVSAGAAGTHLALLRVCVVPSLLAALSDGWSQVRESARELLSLFCDVAPSAVFAEAVKASGDAASCATLVSRAHEDLLNAQTYRNAEGAVHRFVLFATRSCEAQANMQRHPQQERRRLNALLAAERSAVVDKCTTLSTMHGSAAYAFIQANPLHGSLSLCAELLGCLSAMERPLSLAAWKGEATSSAAVGTAGISAATSDEVVLTDACAQLLQCCCVVLRTCSSLVGTETMTAGATAGKLGENEVVDCRGHVYDRSRPEAEFVMRGVVNNTWLSMRVATTAVDRILKVRPVDELPFAAVRAAAYELVHALLLTKHNGVMRCVREALRTLTAALVRSRAPQFYQLPAELLEYLLGPEGVTSGDMARMLRRSQGLPHAILAVLEAEDTAVPYCLFPIAMRQLTRVARGDFPLPAGTVSHFNSLGSTIDDVRRSQRSNALNVLKFIFEDKVFADRVVAYIEEAFSLATEGFHDASWYTRNSSLMLFSAVIHRFVGEHPLTGGSGVNTSLHDVAKRTPRGVAYAYAELTRDNNGFLHGSTAVDNAEVNVALFPVLQLLSMLSPDPPHLVTKASNSEWDDTARMSEAVLRCAWSPSLMVRSASAVALCCLVPTASLTRVITRARRGLSLLPYEPPSDELSHLSGEGHHQQQQQTAHGAGGNSGGLNACHGALLQLLQLHAQYVGTLRRNYKQKRSSYATPAIAETVCRTICEVVLSCQTVLVRACAVCPTVAAAVFALLADLVYFGPRQNFSAQQQEALRALCVAALEAYALSPQGVLERGSVMEGASAVVVFMAAQHRSPVGAWSAAEAQRLTKVLQHEAAGLAIRHGEHNLISWITAHLIHYGDGATAFLNTETTASLLQVLASDVQCDIPSLVLQSLVDFFGSHTAASSPSAGAAVGNIGCIAWGQLVTHLRFATIMLALLPSSTTGGGGDFSTRSSSAVHQLYATVVALLTSAAASPPPTHSSCEGNDNDGAATNAAAGFLCQNSDVCSAAINFIASYDVHATVTHTVSCRVAHILAFYAEPEQPLESRLAVVKALRTSQLFMRRCVAGVMSTGASYSPALSPWPESAVTLLLVLLRLLVDDTSNIRDAVASICSHCLWGPLEAPRDQVSCLLVVVRLLRSLHTAGQLTGDSAAGALLAIAGVRDNNRDAAVRTEAPTAEAAAAASFDDGNNEEESDDAESGEEGEDVLFQKEAANMFAEETVLLCLCGHIFGTDVSCKVASACRSFSLFDKLLN